MTLSDTPEIPAVSGHQQLLKSEQVKLLYAAIPLTTLVTIFNANVLAALEWDSANHGPLLSWLACMLSIAFIRFVFALAYKKAQPGVEQTTPWERYFIISTLAAGAAWGGASVLIFPEHDITHQVLLAFIVGGMSAGAVFSLSSLRLPIFGFLFLAMGPLIIRFFLTGTEMGIAMAAMLFVFSLVIAASANRTYLSIIEDIELRIQSQADTLALVESEARFRELFEGGGSIELIIDPEKACIIEANHAAVNFYGYAKDQLIGMSVADIDTLSKDELLPKMQQCKSAKEKYFLLQHRLANGEIRDVELYCGPISWKGQRVLYSIIHDVSERMRAEHIAKKTSQTLEMIASGKTEENIYEEICQAQESMYPRMRASILRLQGNQLFHCSAPSLPAEYCEAINGVEIGPCVGSCGTAAFLGKEVIVEDIENDPLWADYKHVALPHNLRACWSEPIVGSDGAILGTFAMYFDQITKPEEAELVEIKNASKLLAVVMEKEQREALLLRLSQAVEQAGESVIITNKQGIIEYVNSAFTRITGYSPEEVLGKNPRVLKSGLQEPEYYQRLWETISSGEIWESAITDRRKDGSEYPALMTISPIRDSSGEISHYVGIQQDMTSHKVLEDKFRQAQKMQAIGTLVGGIAHDFNNMLAGITANLYLAKHKVTDSPDVVKILNSVETLSFRAADMIQQLLTFARKGHVTMQAFGLTSFLKETTKLNEVSIPENIGFHCEFCPEELIIKADATQLQQVVMNLLNNARDATADVKDPRVSLSLAEFKADQDFIDRHPEIAARLFAHIIIEDNGSGIADDDRERIFEPFYTTKEVGQGSGLGLSMAYGSIQSHHGAIEVHSALQRGTSFHIYLPIVQGNEIGLTPRKTTELVSGQGEFVLVVDDNANVRNTCKQVLQTIGYKVLEASDGLEAIEQFSANQNDIALIIMDVVMPKLGGVAAAEQIKQMNPGIPIIFATGYDKEAVSKSEMPSDEYIIVSKPYNVEALSWVIREQLKNTEPIPR